MTMTAKHYCVIVMVTTINCLSQKCLAIIYRRYIWFSEKSYKKFPFPLSSEFASDDYLWSLRLLLWYTVELSIDEEGIWTCRQRFSSQKKGKSAATRYNKCFDKYDDSERKYNIYALVIFPVFIVCFQSSVWFLCSARNSYILNNYW